MLSVCKKRAPRTSISLLRSLQESKWILQPFYNPLISFEVDKTYSPNFKFDTRFAVVKTNSPNFYKPPTRFELVQIGSLNFDKPPTHFAVAKTDSVNFYKPHFQFFSFFFSSFFFSMKFMHKSKGCMK